MNIIIPIAALGGLGAIFSVWLMFASRLFAVKMDPKVERILSLLPGANCGACGLGGCSGFAKALVEGKIEVGMCGPSDPEAQKEIAGVLGVAFKAKLKTKASVVCGGGTRCKDQFEYTEPAKTCVGAALLLGGHKACAFGCLGFGDCLKVCPFDAIKMGQDNIPIIDMDKCTGCGKCAYICPKDVILLIPEDKHYYIKCNSKDKGPAVMKVCKAGCIACGKCVKACPVGAITIEDNLARINYEKCIDCGKCLKVCPTHAIAKRERGQNNG